MRTLVIGNKNYSSWSLRPWLALKVADLAFDEVMVNLGDRDRDAQLRRYSPSGLVPVLNDGDLTIWDTLAICEHVNELAPEAKLWPAEREARAIARSVAAEMHSSFAALRSACPMNIRRRSEFTPDAAVLKDVTRVRDVWSDCRARYGAGGPYLFGGFTIADAMYAPVCTRFRTYGLPEDEAAAAYIDAVLAHPAMVAWSEAAARETWTIPRSDL